MQGEPLEGQFLVERKRCYLRLDADGISWSPVRKGTFTGEHVAATTRHQDTGASKTKRISFDRMIGTVAREKVTKSQEQKTRFKVYYCRPASSRSSRQLLKLKKITIEVPKDQKESLPINYDRTTLHLCSKLAAPSPATTGVPSSRKTTVADGASEAQLKDNTVEPPPSCYVSEGSTSHLSSLSCSSARTSSRSPIPHSEGESSSLKSSNGTETSVEKMHSSQSSNSATTTGCLLLQSLMQQLVEALEQRRKQRPHRLLVFVNPHGGKGRALHVYKSQVRRLFELAQVEATLVVTKYANHARDTVEDIQFNVEHFDGVVCIGGDGMFSELMNGLLFRYNRDNILSSQLHQSSVNLRENCDSEAHENNLNISSTGEHHLLNHDNTCSKVDLKRETRFKSHSERLDYLRSALGGIGKQFLSPPIPIGVIGAGSTDANSFGLIGTNDVITATLNIILGNQINIDICSVHSIQDDRVERFVSTFVAYGYFGDVIRESEKLRWLGPSRYDVTGVNNLIKNRTYSGRLSILTSSKDGSPLDLERCHVACERCYATNKVDANELARNLDLSFVEQRGSFVGINAAVTACRCPQTKKGFSPNNHLANGCADLILVRPCTRMQYLQYLLRIGWTNKSAFDLKYVETFRCRQFEFISAHQDEPSGKSFTSTSSANSSLDDGSNSSSLDSKHSSKDLGGAMRGIGLSSWNVDGEILNEHSIRVKVNNRLLTVFGTGEPRL